MVTAYSGDRLMPREQQIFAHLPKGKLLDLGCGTGRTTAALAAKGFDVVGLDLSEAMIVEARRLHPELPFFIYDASDLTGFEDEDFDYVLFSYNGLDLLHPYETRVKCLTESHRVLKEGGLFIYSSHNRGYTSAHPETCKPIGGGYIEFRNPNGPEVVYATHIDEQVQQLKEVGLQMNACYTDEKFNYYVAKKSAIRREPRIIRPPSPLLTLPGRALRKLGRIIAPPTRTTIVIDLTQPVDTILENVKKQRRAEIRQGNGHTKLETLEPPYPAEYLEWEGGLSRETGLFPIPRKWLEEGHLFIGRDKNGYILSALLTHERGKSLVLRRDSSMRDAADAHAALTWYAILWAAEHGFREFDQGGYNAEKHPGVSSYKAEYGGKVAKRRAPE